MEKAKKIVVLGSSNTDMVVKSGQLPRPGETVLGGRFEMVPGGKGANQAVAAARLGADVTFVAKLGADLFGQDALRGLKAQGLNTDFISIDQQAASGVALIIVDEQGENCISVASGTNGLITPDDVDQAAGAIASASYLLVQLEIPLPAVSHAISLAKASDTRVILNPAPACPLSDELLNQVDIITPNQTEAELLTGIVVNGLESAQAAAVKLLERGVNTVIITMGSQGAYLHSKDLQQLVPTSPVKVVDTTAAGDTFNGALTVALSEGMSLTDAVAFANRAAAYSVTRFGAQTSAPTREALFTTNPS